MSNNFVDKGIAHINGAVEFENNKSYADSFGKYKLGAECLLMGAKYEKNSKVKKTLLEKAEKYLVKAKQMKEESLKKKPIKKSKATNTNSSKNNKKSESDEGSEEKDELESSLSSAIVVSKPNVKWDDVAGLVQAKAMLKEAVIVPLRFPQFFEGKRKPWRGILLYGPPGTGKSFLAKAVANEAGNSTFFSVSSSDLISKFVGESERLVKALFNSARKRSPAIIFIDEIDSICGSRSDGESDASRRVKTEILVQMQGVGNDNKGILVLGATNTPWSLDPAVRRRFEKRVYIPLPDKEARVALFRILNQSMKSELSQVDYEKLGEMTDGFSGSDIDSFTSDALYEPVRDIMQAKAFKPYTDENGEEFYSPCSVGDPEAIRKTAMELPAEKVKPSRLRMMHFLSVFKNATSSVSNKDIERHIQWTEEFGMEG